MRSWFLVSCSSVITCKADEVVSLGKRFLSVWSGEAPFSFRRGPVKRRPVSGVILLLTRVVLRCWGFRHVFVRRDMCVASHVWAIVGPLCLVFWFYVCYWTLSFNNITRWKKKDIRIKSYYIIIYHSLWKNILIKNGWLITSPTGVSPPCEAVKDVHFLTFHKSFSQVNTMSTFHSQKLLKIIVFSFISKGYANLSSFFFISI